MPSSAVRDHHEVIMLRAPSPLLDAGATATTGFESETVRVA